MRIDVGMLPDTPDSPVYDRMLELRNSTPDGIWQPVWAALGASDLWFMVRHILSTQYIPQVAANHPWLFDRAREIQASPDWHLDVWAREHFKSTLITFAMTIWELALNPEETYCIFSHTRPIAKGFLRVIKRELEDNTLLKSCYPDSFYWDPAKESPKWNEDDGITVRRIGNPKEASVEAWGLVDGQPTSKHYGVRLYDDVVTDKSVTTPEMIKKTTEAFELSDNLGKDGGKARFIGTRYHLHDTYATIMERKIASPRIYPCVDKPKEFPGGTWNSVLFSDEYILNKRRTQGEYTFAAQNLCNPLSEGSMGFDANWLKFYETDPWKERKHKNVYIVCDPASRKRNKSEIRNDYTAMWVIGLGEDKNYYVLDMIRDRLSLTERCQILHDLHRAWRPLSVGYEEYGKDSDIEHFEDYQSRVGYRFEIIGLGGNQHSKEQRIMRLAPKMEEGRFFFPRHGIWRVLRDTRRVNLVEEFIKDELDPFPLSKHDDAIDALSRILDPAFPTLFPDGRPVKPLSYLDEYDNLPEPEYGQTTWMAM